MAEVSFIGFQRVVILKRAIAIDIARVKTVEFGQHDRLDDREALQAPVFEVLLGVFA